MEVHRPWHLRQITPEDRKHFENQRDFHALSLEIGASTWQYPSKLSALDDDTTPAEVLFRYELRTLTDQLAFCKAHRLNDSLIEAAQLAGSLASERRWKTPFSTAIPRDLRKVLSALGSSQFCGKEGISNLLLRRGQPLNVSFSLLNCPHRVFDNPSLWPGIALPDLIHADTLCSIWMNWQEGYSRFLDPGIQTRTHKEPHHCWVEWT